MSSPTGFANAQDIDVAALGRSLWRAKGWVIGVSLAAGFLTFVGLSMVRPLYTSESRVLIVNDVSPFTRAESDQGRDQQQTLDEQAVQSQVQVLNSRDLALEVTKELHLADNPEFAKDAGVSLFRRLLNLLGLNPESDKSRLEKAADAFSERLAVYALNKSSVIAIDYTSGDRELAAAAANKLADVYIEWQRKAKLSQTKDASSWLNSQIEELRKKVGESEAAVETFRASSGLYEGSNNITLNAQQLSEVNSQLIMAKAQKSEAEARARLIKKMLEANGDIDATPEVLKSELIGRLIEQRVQVQRQLAELSATLMPSHPRIKQLSSELADVRSQIRDEATKIVKGLENEAEVASAREASLRGSLNDVKSQASGQSEAEIKLRALEREAKANRDLLEAYLARYRDASARHDMDSVPADATIVSRAHASTTPSFPKRGPMTALVTAATALLSIAYVLARELIRGTAAGATPLPESEPVRRSRQERAPVPPLAAEAPPPPPPAPEPASAAARAAAASETRRMPPHMEDRRRPAGSRRFEIGHEDASAEPAVERERRKLYEALTQREPPQASFIDRLRRSQAADPKPNGERPKTEFRAPNRPTLDASAEAAPNDLRRYFQQKAVVPAMTPARGEGLRPKPSAQPKAAPAKPANGKTGPVLKSLNAVLNHILTRSGRGPAGIILVAPAQTGVETAGEAIEIGRMLASARRRVVLVDLSRGSSAISGELELARVPGFTDLVAGKAGFEDVVQVDEKTPLQVIAAGSPALKIDGNEAARCAHVFEALAQAYDGVVLCADTEALAKLEHALEGRLAVIVPLLAPGAGSDGEATELRQLAHPGCQILPFEPSSPEPSRRRAGLFGRVAAI